MSPADKDLMDGCIPVLCRGGIVDDRQTEASIDRPEVQIIGGAAFIGPAGLPACVGSILDEGVTQFQLDLCPRVTCFKSEGQFFFLGRKAPGVLRIQVGSLDNPSFIQPEGKPGITAQPEGT